MLRKELVDAVKANDLKKIQDLLNADKADLDEDIVNEYEMSDTANDFSNTIIRRPYKVYSRVIDLACQHGHVAVVELLLKEGSQPIKYRDLSGKEDVSSQPLSSCRIASENLTESQYKIIKLLITAGADLKDFPHNIFPYALDLALQQDDEELFDLLCAKGKKEVSVKNSKKYEQMLNPNARLLKAIARGKSVDEICSLVNRVPNLEFKDKDGNTALLVAALSGQQDLVKKLVYRTNSQAINEYGHRLIHCAVIGGLLEIVKEALVKPAINDLTKPGETLLSLAIGHGHIPIAEFLIENGAKDFNDKYPLLHQAVECRSLEMVKFVLRKFGKNNLNAVDEKGHTALWLAATNDEDKIIEYLLSEGADIFIKHPKELYIFEWKKIRNKSYYSELLYRAADGYSKGFSIEQDLILAEKYYSEAAKYNHAQAQFELSELYRIKYDWFLAVKWQHRAALNQHVVAQYQYGKSLLYGMGIERNIDEAKQWLTTAANKGQAEAQNILDDWENNVKQAQNFKSSNKKRTADLELCRTSKDPKKAYKRIRVEDETIHLREWWKSNKGVASDQRNEIVTNIGLIFTDKPPQKDQSYDLVFETLPIRINGRSDYDIKNFPLNFETFYARTRKRINDGEIVYSNYRKRANKIQDLNLNFFNRKHTDTSPQKNGDFLKHSEQCYYEYLSSPEAARDFLDSFIQRFPTFTLGCKVYCVVMDMYSVRCMCPNCKIATVGMQNPVSNNFLKNLQDELVRRGYKILSKPVGPQSTHLKMVTRVRYDDESTVYPDNNNVGIKHENCSVQDIQYLNNMAIFEQKHPSESDKDAYTAFRSGT